MRTINNLAAISEVLQITEPIAFPYAISPCPLTADVADDIAGVAVFGAVGRFRVPKLGIVSEGGDEVIHEAIEALEGGKPLYTVMNYKNLGQCREFPIGMVVETFCTIDATGVHPAIANPLPKPALNVSLATGNREEMFMEAAMEWDEKKLVAALCNDPLVQDFTRVKAVAHDIMEYNKKWLPDDFERL